jgi:hypothetical protein
MLGAGEFAEARQPAVRRVGTSGVSLGTRKEDSDAHPRRAIWRL